MHDAEGKAEAQSRFLDLGYFLQQESKIIDVLTYKFPGFLHYYDEYKFEFLDYFFEEVDLEELYKHIFKAFKYEDCLSLREIPEEISKEEIDRLEALGRVMDIFEHYGVLSIKHGHYTPWMWECLDIYISRMAYERVDRKFKEAAEEQRGEGVSVFDADLGEAIELINASIQEIERDIRPIELPEFSLWWVEEPIDPRLNLTGLPPPTYIWERDLGESPGPSEALIDIILAGMYSL